MKKYFFIVAFLSATQIVFAQNQPLLGSWQMVSQNFTINNAAYRKDAIEVNAICIYTATEYPFMADNVGDNLCKGQFFAYGGMGKIISSKGSYSGSHTHGTFTNLSEMNFGLE